MSCGTLGGAAKHQRRKEPLCPACRAAKASWMRVARERWAQELTREELLAELKALNHNLRRLGLRPTFRMRAARALSNSDLRDAVAETGHELVREGRAVHEGTQ